MRARLGGHLFAVSSLDSSSYRLKDGKFGLERNVIRCAF